MRRRWRLVQKRMMVMMMGVSAVKMFQLRVGVSLKLLRQLLLRLLMRRQLRVVEERLLLTLLLTQLLLLLLGRQRLPYRRRRGQVGGVARLKGLEERGSGGERGKEAGEVLRRF